MYSMANGITPSHHTEGYRSLYFLTVPKRRKTDANDKDRKIADLEARLLRQHEVLSELMEEHVQLKKALGEL